MHVIGAVDIGATKLAVGIVDEAGRLLERAQHPTDSAGGFAHGMDQIADMLRGCVQRAGGLLQGIGVGATGQVDPSTGHLGNINNLPGWEGNPVEVLSREFDIPVAIENDANAAALGELYWGPAKCSCRTVCVMIGTGIGVGVIVDGKLYRGAGNAHPEIGHQILDPDGPLCSCGVRGCWEVLAAGPSLPAWMRGNAPEKYAHLSAAEIWEAAIQGDEWCRRGVERQSYYVGLGLANLVTMFVPGTIILGGSVAKNAHLFLDRIRQIICENCRLVPHKGLDIRLASLGPDVGLIGAAQVWHHRFQRCGGRVG